MQVVGLVLSVSVAQWHCQNDNIQHGPWPRSRAIGNLKNRHNSVFLGTVNVILPLIYLIACIGLPRRLASIQRAIKQLVGLFVENQPSLLQDYTERLF